MFTFGVRIILLLLIIGGITALLGDYIGRIIGRKRLTIFNLRPRKTAYAITVITGVLIVFMTIGIILTISKDARTALFGLDELRTEVREKSRLLKKTKYELALKVTEKETIDQELISAQNKLATTKEDLKEAKHEIVALQKTKGKLTKQVEVSRRGKVLFKVGDVLLTSVIQAGPEKAKLELGLKQILSATDAHVRSFGKTSKQHLIYISPKDFKTTVARLQKRHGEQIITVIATRNILLGEVVHTRFNIAQNRLVYSAGTEIAQAAISPEISIPEIEQKIMRLLAASNQIAKEAGVLPDASGSVGRVPYATISSLAKKIKAQKKIVQLKTLAKNNTYSIGPLVVDFKIIPQ